jgi:hypothetical protein
LTLVDTNIVLDFVSRDPVWMEPSRAMFIERAAAGSVFLIDVVFAEASSEPRRNAKHFLCGREIPDTMPPTSRPSN